jgi:hypothetical protein
VCISQPRMWTTPISEFFCNAHIHSNLNLFAVILSWICSLNNSLDPGRSSCLDEGPDGTVLLSIKWQRQNLVGPPTNMGCILISSTQMTQGSGGGGKQQPVLTRAQRKYSKILPPALHIPLISPSTIENPPILTLYYFNWFFTFLLSSLAAAPATSRG